VQYYIAWTHSDAVYHHYIADVGMLVSPPNVNLAWTVEKWPALPKQLMIDSGGFQYCKEGRAVEPHAALARQLQMLAGAAIPTQICHLDIPLLGACSRRDCDRRVSRNLKNASWLIEHLRRAPLSASITPIGVIQGYDEISIYHAARALADMGYSTFALGSLVPIATHNLSEVIHRIEVAVEAIGSNLHILGVSSVKVMERIATLRIRSFDSSAPITESWRGGIFYSQPLRRYKIPSPHLKEWARSYQWGEILEEPLPCICPVCRHDSQSIMSFRGKQMINLRAVHNCFHLHREFNEVAENAPK
jgi:7-cyano-7-deazaguanine tRNA-ribosyltransferase